MHMCPILRSSIAAERRSERLKSGTKSNALRKHMIRTRHYLTSTRVLIT